MKLVHWLDGSRILRNEHQRALQSTVWGILLEIFNWRSLTWASCVKLWRGFCPGNFDFESMRSFSAQQQTSQRLRWSRSRDHCSTYSRCCCYYYQIYPTHLWLVQSPSFKKLLLTLSKILPAADQDSKLGARIKEALIVNEFNVVSLTPLFLNKGCQPRLQVERHRKTGKLPWARQSTTWMFLSQPTQPSTTISNNSTSKLWALLCQQ